MRKAEIAYEQSSAGLTAKNLGSSPVEVGYAMRKFLEEKENGLSEEAVRHNAAAIASGKLKMHKPISSLPDENTISSSSATDVKPISSDSIRNSLAGTQDIKSRSSSISSDSSARIDVELNSNPSPRRSIDLGKTMKAGDQAVVEASKEAAKPPAQAKDPLKVKGLAR